MKLKYLKVALIFLIFSCSTEIEISNYFDSTKPFTIINQTESGQNQLEQMKHMKLVAWLESNNQNWDSTPASYNSELVIEQENFKLMILKDLKSAVVTYKDEDGKSQQYIKSTNPKDLKFLTK